MAKHNPLLDHAFISVDVETAGPDPSRHSLLSIGACVVVDPASTFYVEMQPETDDSTPEAMAVHGLSLVRLREQGVPPDVALLRFEEWLHAVVPGDLAPVFVGFNAPFDWMFVSTYFHRYLRRNPFGHAALDIKALFMGTTGSSWSQTSLRHVAAHFGREYPLTHHAREDAIVQAEFFRLIVGELSLRRDN